MVWNRADFVWGRNRMWGMEMEMNVKKLGDESSMRVSSDVWEMVDLVQGEHWRSAMEWNSLMDTCWVECKEWTTIERETGNNLKLRKVFEEVLWWSSGFDGLASKKVETERQIRCTHQQHLSMATKEQEKPSSVNRDSNLNLQACRTPGSKSRGWWWVWEAFDRVIGISQIK
jgi:hypothetical protein